MFPPVLAFVALAGCGAKDTRRVPLAPAATTTTATTSTDHRASDHFQASVNYVNCMRSHGVDLPDPKPSGEIELSPSDERRLSELPPGAHDAADRLCMHLLAGFVSTRPVSDQALARVADVALEFAACMRKKGYEFGDPQVTRVRLGRIKIFFPDAPFGSDPIEAHPKFAAANAACSEGFNKKVDRAIKGP